MKILVTLTVVSCAIMLSGCMGSIASPTHNEYDNHAVTTTTETTETQTMSQSQVGNRPTCTGLIIINCGNTSQQGAQMAGNKNSKLEIPAPAKTPKPDDGGIDVGDIVSWVLVAFGVVFWFYVAWWALNKIFNSGDSYE